MKVPRQVREAEKELIWKKCVSLEEKQNETIRLGEVGQINRLFKIGNIQLGTG